MARKVSHLSTVDGSTPAPEAEPLKTVSQAAEQGTTRELYVAMRARIGDRPMELSVW